MKRYYAKMAAGKPCGVAWYETARTAVEETPSTVVILSGSGGRGPKRRRPDFGGRNLFKNVPKHDKKL